MSIATHPDIKKWPASVKANHFILLIKPTEKRRTSILPSLPPSQRGLTRCSTCIAVPTSGHHITSKILLLDENKPYDH